MGKYANIITKYFLQKLCACYNLFFKLSFSKRLRRGSPSDGLSKLLNGGRGPP